MQKLGADELDSLRRAAEVVVGDWPAERARLALRALRLEPKWSNRESLDAIAAETGVSRETVRRARNDLLNALAVSNDPKVGAFARRLPAASVIGRDQSLAASRGLRRLLTMTGPLAWDEVLTAWERAGGRPPYTPLPPDIASMEKWAMEATGFVVERPSRITGPVTIDTQQPEELDSVSRFLYDSLVGRPGGVDRSVLLEAAEATGLKATTIATSLSQHPAVMRVGRGFWALRGHQEPRADSPALELGAPRHRRAGPTAFSWDADGNLIIEFSVPRGVSPVVAVPRAVANLVEGREFKIQEEARSAIIRVHNARLWGFGPVVSELKVAGRRAKLQLNLITAEARFFTTDTKDVSQ